MVVATGSAAVIFFRLTGPDIAKANLPWIRPAARGIDRGFAC